MPSQQRGFTLIEMLVVVTIVVILIVVALPSLTRNMPRRKVEDYTLRLMGHLRWAAHRAASSGEDLVLEVIGAYDNPAVTHPEPLEDVLRIWRRADWDRYRIPSTHLVVADPFDTLAPYLVYDLSATSALDSRALGGDGNGLISEAELPVPLREYVGEDYRDPPALLALAQYQVVLNSPGFSRRRVVPREVDMLSPAMDVVGYAGDPGGYRNYVTWAYVRPAGGGVRLAGVLEIALMLRPDHFGRVSWNEQLYACAFEGNLRSPANGRTLQMMLATGDLSVREAAPVDYMRQASVPDRCGGGPSLGPIVYDRGGGWE
ncbi:prepilin-type N-terminal cleavage/methylation domain-containing protein [bacterium]|nr:prepilin-type N-terminal cleavage/methylation domain-containing protein [bacterium]